MSEFTEEAIEKLQIEFDKNYGKGTFTDASTIVDAEQEILSVTPSINLVLSGGVPEGTWVTLSGRPKYGKSTLALTLAANAQKQDRLIVYADVEGRIKKKNLTGILGLDLNPTKFRMIRSTPEKLLNGPEFLNQILSVLESIPRVFVIIDSVSALAEKKEMEEGVEVDTRGNINKRISSFCRIGGQAVAVNKSIVIGITHRIANTSGYGAGEVEKVSNSWKYQRDVVLRAKKVEEWTISDSRSLTGQKQIGQKVDWVVEESALGPPGGEVKTYLRYGLGYDGDYEYYELAKGFGIIHKAEKGGWVTLTPIGNKKYQGDEKAFDVLKNSPDDFEKIKEEVNKFLTGENE